jgi:hypothetical protein
MWVVEIIKWMELVGEYVRLTDEQCEVNGELHRSNQTVLGGMILVTLLVIVLSALLVSDAYKRKTSQ